MATSYLLREMHQPSVHSIFSIQDELSFHKVALDVFKYQSKTNETYAHYLMLLGKKPEKIKTIAEIPFLPIELFKTHKILSSTNTIEKIFSSSGTTSSVQSQHYVSDLAVYEQSFTKAFELFYGKPKSYIIIGLLPSYLEREGSSLVYMVNHLMKESKSSFSGFYLHNLDNLIETLDKLNKTQETSILIGVSYALLDLAEKLKKTYPNLLIMETGGMKGKRKEMVREELHSILSKKFGVTSIHSEYGMTELLSQAYSKGKGVFNCPPWMKVLAYDPNDPLEILLPKRSGGINVIDLANIHSCSFIQTRDLGVVHENGSFEIHGRFDFSDIRGCNLMV